MLFRAKEDSKVTFRLRMNTSRREVQSRKVCPFMFELESDHRDSTVEGMTILVREVHPSKAYPLILSSPSHKVTDSSDVQSRNAR